MGRRPRLYARSEHWLQLSKAGCDDAGRSPRPRLLLTLTGDVAETITPVRTGPSHFVLAYLIVLAGLIEGLRRPLADPENDAAAGGAAVPNVLDAAGKCSLGQPAGGSGRRGRACRETRR